MFEEYGEEEDSDFEGNHNDCGVQEPVQVPRNEVGNGDNSNASDMGQEQRVHHEYTSQLERKMNEYVQAKVELLKCNIHILSRLKQALEVCTTADMVFACNKPKGDDINQRLTFVKEYLIAPLKHVFQFAQHWDKGVWLDEVIKSNRPC